MRKTTILLLLSLMLALLVSGCTSSRYPGRDGRIPVPYPDEREHRREDRDNDWEKRDGDRDSGRVLSFSELGIPKGHLPPPGECKVWYPGKPPGHQPPPQTCASALRSVPLGAWVITHEGSRYKVSIFDRVRRGVIDEVRYYMAQ